MKQKPVSGSLSLAVHVRARSSLQRPAGEKKPSSDSCCGGTVVTRARESYGPFEYVVPNLFIGCFDILRYTIFTMYISRHIVYLINV